MNKKEDNKKKADDLQEITEILNERETKPQPPITAAPPAAATVAPTAPNPMPQMKQEQCPNCKKDIAIPVDFEEGLCPYCRGYLDFRPKIPTELPKRISDQAMANVIKDKYAPPPQPPATPYGVNASPAPPPAAPTVPIPQPLAPTNPPPPIPPQPQPSPYYPQPPAAPPQQNAPSERFVDKRAAAMDVLTWLTGFKTMGYVAIAGSFACLLMGMFYLDMIGMVVLFVVTIYVAFMLKKITTHQNYLTQKYNLIKPKSKLTKPKLGKQQQPFDPRLQPPQPPRYPGGQY